MVTLDLVDRNVSARGKRVEPLIPMILSSALANSLRPIAKKTRHSKRRLIAITGLASG